MLLAAPASAQAADLRTFVSRHYQIHTDLPKPLADDLAGRLDAMYEEYCRRLVEFRPAEDTRFDVYLFARQADYTALVGPRSTNSGGVFLAGRGMLAAYVEKEGLDALRRTLQHEAFHQFAFVGIAPSLPIWINEGMAQLFEEGLWTGRGFVMGEIPPRRIRQLQADMARHRLTPFREFLKRTPEEWTTIVSTDKAAGATQYNQAWAMVQFLVNATDEEGRPVYRDRFIRMLRLLHNGMAAPEAFAEAFSSNIDGFQDRFVEYARGLRASSLATLIERQQRLGDVILFLQTTGRTYSNIRDLHQASRQVRFQNSALPEPGLCFTDAEGRFLDSSRLFLEARRSAPLPDVVCEANQHLRLRTRFHGEGSSIEHETLLEPR